LSHRRAARADRDAARALRALGGAARARRLLLARHDSAARALPGPSPRSGAARARRAVQRARRGRCRAPRRTACGASGRAHLPPRHPRSGACRAARERLTRARDMNYVRDVGALARKDLLLELRARDTLPALPLYALFFHPIRGATVAAVLLADLGICGVGTFLGAMAVVTRARDLLLPLLFLPLAMPIVVGAVGASVSASPGRYLGFLALYDLLFAVICWASFEYVVAE